MFRFIDTAGLRDTDDVIEAIGVKKQKKKSKISILIYMATVVQFEDITNEISELLDSSLLPSLLKIKLIKITTSLTHH